MAITEKYIPLVSNPGAYDENFLEVSVDYDLGGYNWFNSTYNKRGYYLYVTPCHRSNGLVRTQLGKGLKYLLKEVQRQSKKAREEALAMAAEKEAMVVEMVCARYGFVVQKTDSDAPAGEDAPTSKETEV